MRIGVLTGGGDCPGLNAVIRAVTKSLIRQCGAEVIGIEDGFFGLMDTSPRTRVLDWRSVSGIAHRGGTILGTSNQSNPLHTPADTERTLANARALALDGLVVIGGDGSMSIAHGLAAHGLRSVGVPKTIDNDIVDCERSFGFDTAVATATDGLMRIETTAMSHSRVMIVETMGRHAGWIALEAGLAAAADIVLLPEIDYAIEAVARVCQERESKQRYTVICIGEGAKARGADITVQSRVAGSFDAVRLGGVAHVLREQLQPHLNSEVRATVLGHVQRGGQPTPYDRVLATRFGHHAAQLVAAGRFGEMVTLRDGALGSVPMARVANQQRTIAPDHPLLVTAREIGVSLGEA